MILEDKVMYKDRVKGGQDPFQVIRDSSKVSLNNLSYLNKSLDISRDPGSRNNLFTQKPSINHNYMKVTESHSSRKQLAISVNRSLNNVSPMFGTCSNHSGSNSPKNHLIGKPGARSNMNRHHQLPELKIMP